MYINEQYPESELTRKISCQQITADGQREMCSVSTLEEHILDVFVNDVLTMKLVCIPQFLAELVLGRLITESIIYGIQDVEGLCICEHGKRAKVLLKNRETVSDSKYLDSVKPIAWNTSWIFQLAGEFAKDLPLHKQTVATHSCFLARAEEILFQCEDIGRHNALDKAIGFALRNGINLRECIVYTSGRIPTDMVTKAIKAGLPILASKAAVTAEAVSLAKEYGLTLIGSARRDSFKQYTGKAPMISDV